MLEVHVVIEHYQLFAPSIIATYTLSIGRFDNKVDSTRSKGSAYVQAPSSSLRSERGEKVLQIASYLLRGSLRADYSAHYY
jgi:hypothetical protein